MAPRTAATVAGSNAEARPLRVMCSSAPLLIGDSVKPAGLRR